MESEPKELVDEQRGSTAASAPPIALTPVLPRLLPPLALMLILWTGVIAALIIYQYQAMGGMHDDSVLYRALAAGGLLSVVLISGILLLIVAHVRRTDDAVRRLRSSYEESERRFLDVMYASDEAIVLIDENGFVDCNAAAARLLGYPSREAFISTERAVTAPPTQPDGRNSAEKAKALERRAFETGFQRFEWINRHADGHDFPADVSITPVIFRGKRMIYCVWRDITSQKENEREREALQAQLAHAQKMESVGRLAGGIAHDYNNMLSVIIGHAELGMQKLEATEPLFEHLKEIEKAADRSVALTRQLLAFARKQIIDPVALDLNEAVAGMLSMLKRLIGEDIDMAWKPANDIGTVFIDPSQIDQILANLCVNARDAIRNAGKITIETRASHYDHAFVAEHEGFASGHFVTLSVSDDGCGMTPETMERIFEPFFTTKGVGHGTGLGLATVYGIVRQNNGFIKIYSEVGKGTSVNIHLPRYQGQDQTAAPAADADTPLPTGTETVLLVEDETANLKLTQSILEQMGYTVLPAATPEEAFNLAQQRTEPIDLLFTDVVMPEMNGRDLADTLLCIHPEMKVLYASGYTTNAVAHHGVLDDGVHFIHKPFSRRQLATAVRRALED